MDRMSKLRKYSTSKNSGVELDLSTMGINYNLVGGISASLTLFWAFFMAPNNLTSDVLIYFALEKYLLIVLCFIVYEKVMLKMKFPYKLKIEEDGLVIQFKIGGSKKINVDQFLIDNAVDRSILNNLKFKVNKPVGLLTYFDGKELILIVEEEEISINTRARSAKLRIAEKTDAGDISGRGQEE